MRRRGPDFFFEVVEMRMDPASDDACGVLGAAFFLEVIVQVLTNGTAGGGRIGDLHGLEISDAPPEAKPGLCKGRRA